MTENEETDDTQVDALVARIDALLTTPPCAHCEETKASLRQAYDDVDNLLARLKDQIRCRDEALVEVERLRRLTPVGTYSLDWNHEQERQNSARAAYRRGAEAMRQAAASAVHDCHTTGLLTPAAVTAAVRVIHKLSLPEYEP